MGSKNSKNKRYTYLNNDYYRGPLKNGLPNGKGIRYYPNGNIRYEGDFVVGKAKGQGKYTWENGNYYIGQWLNDKKHGKGKKYEKGRL